MSGEVFFHSQFYHDKGTSYDISEFERDTTVVATRMIRPVSQVVWISNIAKSTMLHVYRKQNMRGTKHSGLKAQK